MDWFTVSHFRSVINWWPGRRIWYAEQSTMSGFQYDVVGIKLNQTKETIIFRPNVVHISGVHI